MPTSIPVNARDRDHDGLVRVRRSVLAMAVRPPG
jgi:hypothetical protein